MSVLRRTGKNLVCLMLGNDDLSLGRVRDSEPHAADGTVDHFSFIRR